MRAFYGSKISEHMTTTPEGFLICLDVPIARTGTQEYLRSELGMEDDPDGVVTVYRTEEEVFSPATIASFEGKCVTEDHPPDSVTPDNVTAYNSGHAQHIRRGAGEQSDLLMADLFITDPRLIDAIGKGLREISCGYECEYQEQDGKLYQRHIRGNHVAVVQSGRAGHRVAIQDSQHTQDQAPESLPAETQMKGDKKTMEKDKKKTKNSLFARMFSRAVRDMEPEEIADALDEMSAQAAPADEAPAAPAPAPAPAAEPAHDEGADFGPQILAAIKALGEQIMAALKPAAAPADALEQLADELGAPAEQEASTTVPADELPVTADEDGPKAPEEQKPENPIPGADRSAALAAIKAVRGVIAQLPEDKRRAANDAAAAEIRKTLGLNAKPKENGYQKVAGVIQKAAQDKAAQAQHGKAASDEDAAKVGQNIMAARNPHYMKK